MRARPPMSQPSGDASAPTGELDIEAEVDKDSEASAAAGEEMAAANTPPLTEALRPDTMSKLSAILPMAIERVSGGQIPSEQVVFPTEAGPGEDRLPPSASKWLLAVSDMVEQFSPAIPGLDGYRIDKSMLSTNDGIIEAAMTIDALSRDSKLVRALGKGPGQAPKNSKQPAAPTAAQE
jgi:hypothetical protein